MAKELKPRQLEARRKARQLAATAGKNWKELSKDERKPFFEQARNAASSGGAPGEGAVGQAPNAIRDQAMMAAKKAGRVWRDLPKEERERYFAQARDDRQKQLAQARRQKT
jgi:hypothetical protein